MAAILKNEKGTALFLAVMMLMLVTGLGLMAFSVSTTEMRIAAYSEKEGGSIYLAESGVEKVFSWISDPDRSPEPLFFRSLGPRSGPVVPCSGTRATPDFQAAASLLESKVAGPFSELKEMGRVGDLRLYRSSLPPDKSPNWLCTVEIRGEGMNGAVKILKVELSKSPLKPITAPIQGKGNRDTANPIWAHWGSIRYRGEANLGVDLSPIPKKVEALPPSGVPYRDSPDNQNQDGRLEIHVEKGIVAPQPHTDRSNLFENDPTVALDSWSPDEIKRFAKRYGSYYVVGPDGQLEQGGARKGTFDTLFGSPENDYGLVYIDRKPGYSGDQALILGGGSYRGYFYISGDVQVQGNQTGRSLDVHPPASSAEKSTLRLADIHLDGLLYVRGRIDLQGPFRVYGAVMAEEGFTGADAGRLEVWYNDDFLSASYTGLPSVVPQKGTWLFNPSPVM